MDDAGEGSRATRRQVLGATAGALTVRSLSGRGVAQQASGPTVYVGSNDETLYAVDADSGEQEWAFTQPSNDVASSPTVVADLASGDSVGSRVLLGTMGHHGDRGDQGTNPTPANFEVTIEQTTEPVAGERLEVTAGVANTGDSSGTQTVDLTVSGLGSDSTTVSLDGGNSTEQVLSVSTEEDYNGDYTATVESEDDSAQQTVTVRRPVTYPISITDATSPVAGEIIKMTVAVENTGDVSGTQTVALEIPELGTDSVAVSLGGGEYTVTVQTNNNEATATATVSEPAGDGDTGSPSDGTGAGSDDGNTPDDSTSGDDSTDPTDDGNSTGDGGLGTTEMAAVGGGGSLALLPGHTR